MSRKMVWHFLTTWLMLNIIAQALGVKLPFNEMELLKENTAYMLRKLELQEFHVHAATEQLAAAEGRPRILDARPGAPVALFSS